MEQVYCKTKTGLEECPVDELLQRITDLQSRITAALAAMDDGNASEARYQLRGPEMHTCADCGISCRVSFEGYHHPESSCQHSGRIIR